MNTLSRINALSNCDKQDRLNLTYYMVEHIVEPGEEVYDIGDSAEDVMLLAEGTVVLKNDEDKIMRKVSRNEIFGENVLLGVDTRTETCEACSYVKV